MKAAACRFCGAPLHHTFVDLGMSPLCESFVPADRINDMEPFYPLHVWVCDQCLLVQLQEYVAPENIFTDYAYFSSYSDSWLHHAKRYTDLMAERFKLGAGSQVVEIASNDGYLLQYFVEKGIPVLGVEPAANVAEKAIEKGIPTEVRFFGVETAQLLAGQGKQADLLLGNNVLAHVPDINDFVAGMKLLLKPSGLITMEFPHLARLMEGNQYDTIYHEHFSYLSFTVVEKIFAAHGLALFDVEELKSHGGSLRIYACHAGGSPHLPARNAVAALLQREAEEGFASLAHYQSFGPKVIATKHKLLEFLIQEKRAGRQIAGYGAPGKGNTLLNYCGIRTDFLDYTVDRNPFKHGRFCPGTHIPIYPVEKIRETKPDLLLILPWNLKEEIMKQMAYIREWGGRFIVPIPEVNVYT
ncbi:MAG: class I SAM-dependent methyltransferase [Candidatus Hydrogenedentes bacterium]|nr:class I SAM-dependent methyltransferase [Candidatus Hydrogenedentota bacterium]